MDKRYQVFISSTYTDLKDERRAVYQTLMEMDCIPAGMELFPATDEEQWLFIQKIIDDSDYYILILGGRYGSMTADGVSYTEKEFDYAVEKGIKVIALIHGEPGKLPVEKSEMDPAARKNLEHFRNKAATGRLVKFWTGADQLSGLVATSLLRTMKTFPAVGWVRAVEAEDNTALLAQINEMRKADKEKDEKIKKLSERSISSVEKLIKESVSIELITKDKRRTIYSDQKTPITVNINIDHLFNNISPNILNKIPQQDFFDIIEIYILNIDGNFYDGFCLQVGYFNYILYLLSMLDLIKMHPKGEIELSPNGRVQFSKILLGYQSTNEPPSP